MTGILSSWLEKTREQKVKKHTHGVILDIGCGPAHAYSYPFVKRYFGIDLKKEDIERLKLKYPEGHFFAKNLEIDPIHLSEKVDVVIMTAFLEHIKNYESVIEQAVNNLNVGGKILITTPTKFGHKVHWFGALLGLFSKEAAEDHKSILSKNDFRRVARKFNIQMIHFHYFQFFCNQFVVYKK